MSICNKIKMLCTEKGMSLYSLENMLGLGAGTIRRWDINSPSVDKLLKVANYFKVSTDFLLDNDGQVSDLSDEFPEGVQILRRANNTLTEKDKAKMVRLIQAFLDEE